MNAMTATLRSVVARPATVLLLLAVGACAGLPPAPPPKGTAGAATESAPKGASIEDYLQILDRLAPGDATRQYEVVAELAAAVQQAPTATNRLKHALALGAAGRPDSNPIEAKRLVSELLAEQNDLRPLEVSLANAWLREFDARVALYADLARQHEESERERHADAAESDKRIAALNAETQRLRKALLEAERKLEAVAEMEKPLAPPEAQ